jgi:hypothetical protein
MSYLVYANTSEVVPLIAFVTPDHIVLICGLTKAIQASGALIYLYGVSGKWHSEIRRSHQRFTRLDV